MLSSKSSSFLRKLNTTIVSTKYFQRNSKMRSLISTLIVFGFVVNLTSGIPFETKNESNTLGHTSRIFGGSDAKPGSGGYMAALVYGIRIFVCGGSLVSRDLVMTAAHCIDAVRTWTGLVSSLRGVIGTHVWHNEEITIEFTNFINHPDWNSRLIKYDIGFLFVKGEIPLGPNVAIVPIKIGFVGGGVASVVSGWGLVASGATPDHLQVLSTKSLSHKDCDARLTSLGPGIVPYDPIVEICTWHSVGHGNCYGDSGSALYEEATGCQTGIVSWGIPCAVAGPDVYTRLSGVIDFVISVLGLDHENYCI